MNWTKWERLVMRLEAAVSAYYGCQARGLRIPDDIRTEFFAALDAMQNYRNYREESETHVTVKVWIDYE